MRFFLSKTSQKYLSKLEKGTRANLVSAIERLPDKGDIQKMRGRRHPNIYRLRVGRHRILYAWEGNVIKVLAIDTRGDIYK